MKRIWIAWFLLIALLSACAPKATPVPATPRPTWTQPPHGTFTGCMIYEGRPVKGYFNIYDKDEEIIKTAEGGTGECSSVMLPPGFYWVGAEYWKGQACMKNGCFPEEDYLPFEIGEGEVIKMEIEVFSQ